MKTLTRTRLIQALTLGALFAVAAGCSKDPAPDTMTRDVIIETGYVECGAPADADACDGIVRCVDADEAQICVQAPADECVDALTCDCVGAWVCGELPCADVADGFTCGEAPEPPPPPPPPPPSCLRVAPEALVFARVNVGSRADRSVTIIAVCPATLNSVELLDDTDPAYTLAGDVEQGEMALGDSVQVTVRFDASEPGQFEGTLRVNGDPALDVPLTAEAQRPIGGNCVMADVAAVDFGDVQIGQTARRSVQVSVNCDGEVTSMLSQQTPETGTFAFVGPVDGPVQGGEGFEVVLELTPGAPGEARAVLQIGGFGPPVSVQLSANIIEAFPDCRAEGVGCLGGLICNDVGACVDPVRFRLELAEGAPDAYVQLWPTAEPYVMIDDADAELTGFNPGSIFEPCDACDAEPGCAEAPPVVGAVGQMDDLIWGQTWWRTDTPDGDDCARPQPFPEGNYLATFCVSYEAQVDGGFDEDGRAPGTIGQSVCLDPVPFTLPAQGDVVGVVPAP